MDQRFEFAIVAWHIRPGSATGHRFANIARYIWSANIARCIWSSVVVRCIRPGLTIILHSFAPFIDQISVAVSAAIHESGNTIRRTLVCGRATIALFYALGVLCALTIEEKATGTNISPWGV
jgi:hypothetical protein